MDSHTTEDELSVDNAILDVLDLGTIAGGTTDFGTHDSVRREFRQSCNGRGIRSGCGFGIVASVTAIIRAVHASTVVDFSHAATGTFRRYRSAVRT